MLFSGKRVSSASELWNRDVKDLFESWSKQFLEDEAVPVGNEEEVEAATTLKEYSVDSMDEGSVEVSVMDDDRFVQNTG